MQLLQVDAASSLRTWTRYRRDQKTVRPLPFSIVAVFMSWRQHFSFNPLYHTYLVTDMTDIPFLRTLAFLVQPSRYALDGHTKLTHP